MTEPTSWLEESAVELRSLLAGAGHSDERVLQAWLERHPAFVPGLRGPRGVSAWRPWPSALVTQPALTGVNAKIPDFCWLTIDSAELTAMLIEIEVPAKRWQHKQAVGQAADLTAARDQVNSWRAWFADPVNQVRFLDDFLVPSSLRTHQFRQHYILIHGSRCEYEGNALRVRARAGGMSAPDETLMSFDRLPEIGLLSATQYGCVRRAGDGFEAVAVPPTWDPRRLNGDALQLTRGYGRALEECADIDAGVRERLLTELERETPGEPPTFRYRP